MTTKTDQLFCILKPVIEKVLGVLVCPRDAGAAIRKDFRRMSVYNKSGSTWICNLYIHINQSLRIEIIRHAKVEFLDLYDPQLVKKLISVIKQFKDEI